MDVQKHLKGNPYRLARTVEPRAYRLRLQPDLERATFSGSAEIDIEITESVTSLALNAIELSVSSATFHMGERVLASRDPVLNVEFETATFVFDEALPLGSATLQLDFTGVLNDQLRGFYRSTYEDDNGDHHVLATTQFCTTDARRAFPCWDDPARKATFQVTLAVPEELAAYSNTREVSSTGLGDGMREVRFAETMVMSTYLVAFVVGSFDVSPAIDVGGTPFRVVYPKGRGHLVDWASEVAVHALTFYSDYFAIPYPGDKVDLVAIPDFAMGAMENLGLVTFREADLLVDPLTASHAEIERVAVVVNHELAHMWFGDLVTMDWWQGIWLNEAFATFLESLCTDAFRPEWRKWVAFNPTRDVAFAVDAQPSTRPIEYPVVSPDECRGMFDVLTYIKGCAVLRMLEQYLGASTFRDGIRIYLRRHAYANAVTADLWTALEEVSSEPVGTIMDTWILQGGFPLVTVERDTITQERFAYSAGTSGSHIGSHWEVPILTRSLDRAAVSKTLLNTSAGIIPAEGVTLVNAGGSGFFRTAYTSEHLSLLSSRLDRMDEIERAILLSDTWAAILAGRLTFDDLLSLALGMVDRDEPAAWGVVMSALNIVDRLVDANERGDFAGSVRRLFRPVHDRLGWDPIRGESSQAAQLRATVIDAIGRFGRDDAVIAQALARFDADVAHGDLANAIIAITMNQGRHEDAETCRRRRRAAATPQDEQRYLFAPATSSDPAVVMSALETAFGDDVRTQDAPFLIGALSRNRAAGEQVWRETTERWDEAIDRFPASSWPALVNGVIYFANHVDLAHEVRDFHDNHPLPVGQREVQQFLDQMDVHVAFTQRSRLTLASTLRTFAEG